MVCDISVTVLSTVKAICVRVLFYSLFPVIPRLITANNTAHYCSLPRAHTHSQTQCSSLLDLDYFFLHKHTEPAQRKRAVRTQVHRDAVGSDPRLEAVITYALVTSSLCVSWKSARAGSPVCYCWLQVRHLIKVHSEKMKLCNVGGQVDANEIIITN